MQTRVRTFVKLLVAAVVILVAVPPAMAHNWGCWIQPNRTVYVRNTATYSSQANQAINEWDADTILSLPKVSYHTEISVYDGNYGATGWGGLASIESYSGCTILHGHARLNYYYYYSSNGKRGVFCQEIGHLFGLDHSNDGGCMGGGYYYSINTHYNVVSHNINDIANKYSGVPALTLDGAADKHAETGDGPVVHALWYHHPRSLAQAARLASAIVTARVAGVYDAPDIVVEVPGLEASEDRIPNQRIAFEVERVIEGSIGKSFDLFHSGNGNYVLDGDPPYEIGQTYLLFLTPRGDGSYLVISPEGRFQVTTDGLEPMSHEGFAQVLRGASVDAVASDLAERDRGNGRK